MNDEETLQIEHKGKLDVLCKESWVQIGAPEEEESAPSAGPLATNPAKDENLIDFETDEMTELIEVTERVETTEAVKINESIELIQFREATDAVAKFQKPKPTGISGILDHDDPESMTGLNIFCPLVPSHAAEAASLSRRVVISRLPHSISIEQLLNGVRSLQGVLSLTLLPHTPHDDPKTISALVEFVEPACAGAYARFVRKNPIVFLDEDGEGYDARVGLIDSPSYPLRHFRNLERSLPFGRAVQLQSFPIHAVWFLINKLGVANVARARCGMPLRPQDEACDEQGNLWLEFASQFEADRCIRFVTAGGVPCFQGSENGAVTRALAFQDGDLDFDQLEKNPRIPYVEPGRVRAEFDVWPYNVYLGLPPGLRAQQIYKSIEQLIQVKALGLVKGGDDATDPRVVFDSTEYRIVGSRLCMTRRQSGWSLALNHDIDLLQRVTLHDPAWTEHWDTYFCLSGKPNLRRFEQYGQLARHRREICAKMGLARWQIPPPCRNCGICPLPFRRLACLG